jgi:hypothetical protein
MTIRLVIDEEIWLTLPRCAIAAIDTTADTSVALPAGVRILDHWRNGRYGGVLFWVGRELDPWGSGDAALHHEGLELIDGAWRWRGGGGGGTSAAGEILARKGVGLHRLGSGLKDPVRLIQAIASPEVVTIELRSDLGVSLHAPGVDGFCLFGITHSDPITYACPLDLQGQPVGSERLLL